jgi:hypothetical protein
MNHRFNAGPRGPWFAAPAAAVAALLLTPTAQACSSCGCSLGTDWSDTGLTTASGLKLDVRFDFIDQNQLREGRSPAHPDPAAPPDIEEIQQGTLTRFYTLSADAAFNRDWGVNAQLPYLSRQHETLPLDGGNTTAIDTSSHDGVGDLRIVGRYQGFFDSRRLGVQFGLKLPTGQTHEAFRSGPDAGARLDRGLQAGTGTTDLIVGVYDHGMLGNDWDRFEQLQYKVALDSSEQFRPSPQAMLNFGLRYVAHPVFVPQLQLNLKWEGREIGAQADYANSGSRVILLSPGATVRLLTGVYSYVFVQLPVYQDYSGYQLAPRYQMSAGLSYHF